MENGFDYLGVLSKDDILTMIKDLEEDLVFLQGVLKNPHASGEQKSETRNDIDHDNAQLRELRAQLARIEAQEQSSGEHQGPRLG